jgi:hypothetical protein
MLFADSGNNNAVILSAPAPVPGANSVPAIVHAERSSATYLPAVAIADRLPAAVCKVEA